jgi:HEAT repeat protein
VPLFRKRNIETLESRRDVKGLVKALRDSDPYTRDRAAEALGNIGDAAAFDGLAAVVRDPAAGASALVALAELSDPRAFDIFAEALADRLSAADPQRTATAAIYGLERLRDARAIPHLVAALSDKNSIVASSASKALADFGTAAVDPVIEALGRGSPESRARAVETLGEIGDPRAVRPLVKALKQKNVRVQHAVALALGEIKDSAAVEPLARVTGEARPQAIVALGKFGAHAVEQLTAARKDENEDVRANAARQLGEIDDPRSREALHALAADEHHQVRAAATAALESLGEAAPPAAALDTDAISALVEELIEIYRTEGFLSLEPGGAFDDRNHHIRAKQIGRELDALGGLEVMRAAGYRVVERTGCYESELGYLWSGIGSWA